MFCVCFVCFSEPRLSHVCSLFVLLFVMCVFKVFTLKYVWRCAAAFLIVLTQLPGIFLLTNVQLHVERNHLDLELSFVALAAGC